MITVNFPETTDGLLPYYLIYVSNLFHALKGHDVHQVSYCPFTYLLYSHERNSVGLRPSYTPSSAINAQQMVSASFPVPPLLLVTRYSHTLMP